MEKWSRYNYLLDSSEIGKFLYNSRTNSFTKLSDALFNVLKTEKIENLPDKVKDKLRLLKAITEEEEDDNYYFNKKFAKYNKCFSLHDLNLTIATTTNCNLRCPYCYEAGASKSNLNIKVSDEIIKFIETNKADNININWYGGEPLLNFKIIKYITGILKNNYKGKKVNYSLITNGSLLNKECVDFFKKYKLYFMQITLDGLKSSHDKSRVYPDGGGSFDKILENLTYATKILKDCKISIRVNLDKRNINEYPILYKLIRERLGENNIYIYSAFIQDYYNKLSHCINREETFDYKNDFFEKYNIEVPTTYPAFQLGGCGAESINSFVVDPEGRLCKCWIDVGRKDRIIGTVMPEDDVKINYDLLSRYMVDADMYSDGKCRYCFLFPVCGGGCAYYRMKQWNHLLCDIQPSDIDKYLVCHYKKLKKEHE